jgi:hypothetical protein
VVSKCDLFVPTERRDRLIEAVQRQVPTATIRWSETGHIRTIMETMRVLPELLSGDEQGGSGTGEPHRIPA